jgi:hypothetical protein
VTRQEAQDAVLRYIQSRFFGMELVVMSERTVEKEYGWIFQYRRRDYVEGGKEHILIGAAPILVERTGKMLPFPSGVSREEVVKRYEAGLPIFQRPKPRRTPLTAEELPDWVSYPVLFLRVLQLDLLSLSPWSIMKGERLLERLKALRERYPEYEVMPFAEHVECLDMACFSKDNPQSVTVIHDFTEHPWENQISFPSFEDWFRAAINDMLKFEPWQERS